jgi:uncharacterized protein
MPSQADPNHADPSNAGITQLLRSTQTIAIVGLSPKPHRDSYGVAHYLQGAGYRVIPVNPVVAASSDAHILGERCYASLHDAAQEVAIDLVNVFRNSEDVPPVADAAIAIQAKALWLQLGITHAGAAAQVRAAGLIVVQNACILIEHRARARAGVLH